MGVGAEPIGGILPLALFHHRHPGGVLFKERFVKHGGIVPIAVEELPKANALQGLGVCGFVDVSKGHTRLQEGERALLLLIMELFVGGGGIVEAVVKPSAHAAVPQSHVFHGSTVGGIILTGRKGTHGGVDLSAPIGEEYLGAAAGAEGENGIIAFVKGILPVFAM
jgi:hypothetical protein